MQRTKCDRHEKPTETTTTKKNYEENEKKIDVSKIMLGLAGASSVSTKELPAKKEKIACFIKESFERITVCASATFITGSFQVLDVRMKTEPGVALHVHVMHN